MEYRHKFHIERKHVGSVGSVILYQVSSALSVTVKSVILLIYKSMTDKKNYKKNHFELENQPIKC